MAYLCISVLLLVGILYGLQSHKFSNLLSVFCFYWVAIIFLASLELFEMIEVSSRTYFIIFIGGLGYIIGYFLSQNFRGVSIAIHNKRLTKIDFPKYEIRYKLAYIAMFIVCVFYLYSLIKIVLLLREGTDYGTIRTMMLHGGEDGIERLYTNLESLFSQYIVVPSVFICVPLSLISVVRGEAKKSFIALTFFDLILYVICTGSRIILASLIVQIVYLMIIYRVTVPKRVTKWLKKIILIGVIAIIIITFMRRSEYWEKINYTIFQSYYSYACLCVPLLDTWLDIIDTNNYITYGLASLKPLLSIPDVIFRQFGISNLDSYYYTVDILNSTEDYFWVFDNKNYNAFVTLFFYFYLDFREIGVFLGSLFYGRFCGKHYRKVTRDNNMKNVLLFLLLLQGFTKMLVRWEFSINNYLIAFIVCRFFLKARGSDND